MFTFATRPLPLRRKMVVWSDSLQLVVLRHVIRASRTARKTRAWIETGMNDLRGYLWLPPVAFVLGMASAALFR
jgi:hypothetical protein